MASHAQPLREKVPCSICGKDLDPNKRLEESPEVRYPSHLSGICCVDCWLRELRTKTAESQLAKALDRVLLE